MLCGDGAPFGFDAARLDDHDVDPEGLDLKPQAIRKPFESKLRGVIPAAEWRVDFSRNGGDVDDSAEPLSSHRRQNGLCQACEAEQVHLELAPGLADRDILDGTIRAIPRIVHEYVDAPLPLDDRFRAGFDGIFIG